MTDMTDDVRDTAANADSGELSKRKVSEYGADQITVLEGLEAVRVRPAMYIGDTGERGYHHCVYEVVDNSIDEAMAGFCKHICVTLNRDGSCSVKDDGRGIPVDIHEKEGKPAVEVVLTKLHAGGKFGNGGYKVSGGLHGVGVSCVNALSEWLEAEVRRNGHVYRIRFSRGKTTQPLQVVGDCDPSDSGTTVSFCLDNEIFRMPDGNVCQFDWDTLSKRLNELSFLNPGVEIRFIDELTQKDERYLHADGISGYIRSINEHKIPVNEKVISIEGRKDSVQVDVAMQYLEDKWDESIFTFANNINTVEGGTHLSGFRTALTRVVNAYARNSGMLKAKDENMTGEDIRSGLVCVISVKLPNPQFEGQTKTKLGNSDIDGVVNNLVGTSLSDFFDSNPKVAAAIVEKALRSQKARKASAKVRSEVLGSGEAKGIHFLGKLADCTSRNASECELYLVEGDSAGGSAKQGRDRRTQAILPLRGKVLNVEKASIERVLENAEIKSLISAIGGGIELDDPNSKSRFDVTKIRYDKIIIMTDADVDGAHIRTLLLTFFYRKMLPLVEQGHIYLAQPPLYMIKRNKREEYVGSDSELTRKLIMLGCEDFVFRSADREHVIDGSHMESFLNKLAASESLCQRLARQNVDVKRLFSCRKADTGEFPHYRVTVDTDGNPADHFVFTKAETDELKIRTAEILGCAPEALDMPENPNYSCTEIKQGPSLRRNMDALRELYGFSIGDYFGVSGRKIGVLTDAQGADTEVESLVQVLDLVRVRGRRGITIQRYKGLGEMNADQLYDTTMDPSKRKMLRVMLEDAVEADKMFTMLMGDEVGPRRNFIEENALMATIDA